MIFVILPSVIFIFGTLVCYFLFIYKLNVPEETYQENIKRVDQLVLEKRNILKEVAGFALGLVDQKYYQELHKQAEELEKQITTKKQKILSIEKEITKTETGLEDVAEVRQELERSQIESQKEIDLLRAQESDINEQNLLAKQELQSVIKNVSETLANVEGSNNLIEDLFAQTGKADQKLQYFQGEIEQLNKKYVELKTQYDSLDIKYAQLYEKDGG